VLSVWDRLHGTLHLNVPQDSVDIGIAGYSNPRDNSIGAVLAMPFRRQRDYWLGENLREVSGAEPVCERSRLAE
jgi:hypothetical protein